MLHNSLFKKKSTWIILALIFYAVVIQKNDNGKTIAENKLSSSKINLKANSDSSIAHLLKSPTQAVLNKLRETSSGKAVVDALITNALEKQYGTSDISIIAAKNSSVVMKFDLLKGSGETAVCGSKVVVKSDSFIDGKIKFDDNKSQSPYEFYIGKGSVIPGLEDGIVGMKAGGKRKLSIPAKLAYDHIGFTNDYIPKGKPIVMEVQLLSVQNNQKISNLQIDKTIITRGNGEAVRCGDNVKIIYKATFKNANNSIITTNPRIANFSIGLGQVPLGLDYGLYGMLVGSTIGISLSPSAQEILKPSNPAIIPESINFPKDSLVNFEVQLVSTTHHN